MLIQTVDGRSEERFGILMFPTVAHFAVRSTGIVFMSFLGDPHHTTNISGGLPSWADRCKFVTHLPLSGTVLGSTTQYIYPQKVSGRDAQ